MFRSRWTELSPAVVKNIGDTQWSTKIRYFALFSVVALCVATEWLQNVFATKTEQKNCMQAELLSNKKLHNF